MLGVMLQWTTVWQKIFAGSNFCDFFAKNKFPQNKITANFFPAKIYSTVEIIFSNSLIIHVLMTQSACINWVRCMHFDTQ